MKTFPMFLCMTDRRVVIVGGGEQAAQKCRLILKTEAQITLVTQTPDAELQEMAQRGNITLDPCEISKETFADTVLVFIATGDPAADATAHILAKAAGALVNVVDQPALCDALTPSIVDRDPVVIAIGTEGTAPVLARQIKSRMEQILEPRLGELAALVGRLRTLAAAKLNTRDRRDLWRWVFDGPVRNLHAHGAERAAAKLIKTAIETGEFRQENSGQVSLIGAGPHADLMTIRGVQRLQEADIIFYDQGIDLSILELARRDATRIRMNDSNLPKLKSGGDVVAAARQGHRVVYLGANTWDREIAGLQNANIAFEVVPGAPQFGTKTDQYAAA